MASTQNIQNRPVSGLYFNPLVGVYGFESAENLYQITQTLKSTMLVETLWRNVGLEELLI